MIDGMLKWTGGGSGVQINYRFAQPGRTERNRQNHLYPEGVFPFAYPVLTDHLSGRTAGRGTRCAASSTCPRIFDANSSNEYWVKAGSLLHTDTRGNDLPDPDNVRFYLISGLSHGVGNVTSKGMCQQFLNPTSPFPALRALLNALDQWVTDGIAPPQSQVPRRADQSAVLAVARPGYQTGLVPQDALGWPSIPGVTYKGLITTRYHLDFGPRLDQGIVSNYPPSLARPAYPIFVSKVDQDGNEVAGIRLPPVEAPVATTTGWALRRSDFGVDEGCEANGQYIPFSDHESGAERCGRSTSVAGGTLQDPRRLRGGREAGRRDIAEAPIPASSRRAAIRPAGGSEQRAAIALRGRTGESRRPLAKGPPRFSQCRRVRRSTGRRAASCEGCSPPSAPGSRCCACCPSGCRS